MFPRMLSHEKLPAIILPKSLAQAPVVKANNKLKQISNIT